ncbi:MAG: STAS domain-containing protein [Phycisphaerales bacterium]|nr:MAG: STAS domain-containing protein [Phycisphaerales bacterium]
MSRNLLIERLFELLISGDHRGARRLVEEAVSDGVSFQVLAQDAYMPLIRIINALHRAEQLTNLAHDFATHILSSLVDDARQTPSQSAQREGTSDAGRPDRGEWLPQLRYCGVERACAGTSPGSPGSFKSGSLCPPRDEFAADGSEPDPRAQFVFFSIRDDVLTARLAGPHIGEREVPIINTEIYDMIRTFGPRIHRLVLDLSDVRVMSSMALGMCLDIRRRGGVLGIKTTATGLSGEMARVFRRLKIDGHRWRQRIAGGVSGLLGRKTVVA